LEDLAGNTPEVTFWSLFGFFWPFRARFDVSGDILTFSEDLAGIAPEVTFWSLFDHFLGFFGLPANSLRFFDQFLEGLNKLK